MLLGSYCGSADAGICQQPRFFSPDCRVSASTLVCNDGSWCDSPCNGVIDHNQCHAIVCQANICMEDIAAECILSPSQSWCSTSGYQDYTFGECISFECPSGQSGSCGEDGGSWDWDLPLDADQGYDGGCTPY